mgnify:CR=1 FL=1
MTFVTSSSAFSGTLVPGGGVLLHSVFRVLRPSAAGIAEAHHAENTRRSGIAVVTADVELDLITAADAVVDDLDVGSGDQPDLDRNFLHLAAGLFHIDGIRAVLDDDGLSAEFIVPRLCVITMNCVSFVSLCKPEPQLLVRI